MVAVDKLVSAYKKGKKEFQVGNHHLMQDEKEARFYYHSTAICVVNKKTGKAKYDNGGWGTSSTTRAINCYKAVF